MSNSSSLLFRKATPVLVALCLWSSSLCAQQASNALPALATDQLTLPANWQRAGKVMASPAQTDLKNGSGNTLLVGRPGQPLTLLAKPTAFALEMEMLMSPGATGQLVLPSGQRVPLTEAHLNKAPGLWQTLGIRYRAAASGKPATLDRLTVNGVILREGQTMTGNVSGPLSLSVQSGSIAIRNVGYRALNNRKVASWAGPLRYSVYDGEAPNKADLSRFKVIKQDTTSAISLESSYGIKPRNFTIVFDGKLQVPEAGTYQFDLDYGGRSRLIIDGKELIKGDYKDLGAPMSIEVPLTAGSHDVEVLFARAWQRPGVGLFVSQPDTRPQALHTLLSLPEPDPVGVIAVKPDGHPELIRSFVQLPGEKVKRTHSLSVGTPAGVHFTLDLDQMALIQAWKGDFADVTEMWYERGEPQLLSPMGAKVLLAPQTPLMVMTDAQAAWPDSASENVLMYKGYSLDKQGMPTAEYTLGGASVTDAIRPAADGLTRTLTLSGTASGPIVCRLAAGTAIEEVEKGLYAVNDRSYYVRIDPKLKPELRSANGKQELRMPVAMKNGTATVQYSIVF